MGTLAIHAEAECSIRAGLIHLSGDLGHHGPPRAAVLADERDHALDEGRSAPLLRHRQLRVVPRQEHHILFRAPGSEEVEQDIANLLRGVMGIRAGIADNAQGGSAWESGGRHGTRLRLLALALYAGRHNHGRCHVL